MKKVLILNGSFTDIFLIKSLKKLGLYVITAGLSLYPYRLGDKIADEHIDVDYTNKEAVFKYAIENKIDYICPNANDLGVMTASYVADKLCLPGNDTYENACIYSEKDKFKQFGMENGLVVIPSHSFDNKNKALNFAENIELPIIFKPVDNSAGRGCIRVDEKQNIEKAIDIAFANSKSKRIVIEPFIVGTQHSITTFLINQKVSFYTSCNEFDSKKVKYMVGYDTAPSDNIDISSTILIDNIEKMAQKLKLKDGIFHLQYIYKNGKPLIIETMRRNIGNLFLRQCDEMNEVSWEDNMAKAYCGITSYEIPNVKKSKFCYMHYYMIAKKNGIYDDVIINNELNNYLYDKIMIYNRGDIVTNCEKQFLGYLFFKFADKNILNKYIANLDKYINIIIK